MADKKKRKKKGKLTLPFDVLAEKAKVDFIAERAKLNAIKLDYRTKPDAIAKQAKVDLIDVDVEIRPAIEEERYLFSTVHQLDLFGNKSNQVQPPVDPEFILYLFMSPADCEALIGDLEEVYRHLVERLGKRRADLWYAKQVFTSIWPLLASSVRRLGSSTVINVLCLVLRFSGQGALADRLKHLSGAKRNRK